MPPALRRACANAPRCNGKTTQGKYCTACVPAAERERNKAIDAQRPTSSKRGYNRRWRTARATFLARHPLCQCEDCAKLPVPLPATVVDHIIPHRGDTAVFWDTKNWQALAKPCHDRKTAREEGGWRAARDAAREAEARRNDPAWLASIIALNLAGADDATPDEGERQGSDTTNTRSG